MVEARKMPKKKTRIVLRKKVYVGQPMTLVDRPGTHSLTNPRAGRALSGRDDASARADSGGQMISRCTVSRTGVPREPVTYSAPAERQVGERAPCSAAWVHIGNPGRNPMKRRIFGLENEY